MVKSGFLVKGMIAYKLHGYHVRHRTLSDLVSGGGCEGTETGEDNLGK